MGVLVIQLSFIVIQLSFGGHSVVIRPSAVIDCHSIVIGYWLLLTAEAQRTQRLIFFVSVEKDGKQKEIAIHKINVTEY